jgi:hypothetical protein
LRKRCSADLRGPEARRKTPVLVGDWLGGGRVVCDENAALQIAVRQHATGKRGRDWESENDENSELGRKRKGHVADISHRQIQGFTANMTARSWLTILTYATHPRAGTRP